LKFTREMPNSLMIRSVSADGIRIGDVLFDHTIGLAADSVLENLEAKSVESLEESDFADLLSGDPEVIVLGTGRTNIFPPRELVFALARRQVGLEVMDTAAAARTYNVLAGEGRRVAALLFMTNE
jgi:uncharacterized protein